MSTDTVVPVQPFGANASQNMPAVPVADPGNGDALWAQSNSTDCEKNYFPHPEDFNRPLRHLRFLASKYPGVINDNCDPALLYNYMKAVYQECAALVAGAYVGICGCDEPTDKTKPWLKQFTDGRASEVRLFDSATNSWQAVTGIDAGATFTCEGTGVIHCYEPSDPVAWPVCPPDIAACLQTLVDRLMSDAGQPAIDWDNCTPADALTQACKAIAQQCIDDNSGPGLTPRTDAEIKAIAQACIDDSATTPTDAPRVLWTGCADYAQQANPGDFSAVSNIVDDYGLGASGLGVGSLSFGDTFIQIPGSENWTKTRVFMTGAVEGGDRTIVASGVTSADPSAHGIEPIPGASGKVCFMVTGCPA